MNNSDHLTHCTLGDISYHFLDAPQPDQINQILALYRYAGWWGNQDDTAALDKLIAGSHCFLTAVATERIVGMGRAISDGVSDAYIQDVAVLKGYSEQGIGTQLVIRLVRRLQADGLSWIGLIAERGSMAFYTKIGFVKMPDADPLIFKGAHDR